MGMSIGDGLGIGGAVVGALGIGAKAADKRQRAQQEALQEIAIAGSKEMTDYNKAAELKMWQDTNLPAQMEMAEKAGLSKAWMMGKGGGTSGQLGSGGSSMSAASAADAAGTENAKTNQAMAIAQMENIAANTEKTKAETENISGGVKENLTQDIKNKQAQEALTRGQQIATDYQNLESNLSRWGRMHAIEKGAKILGQQLEIIENDKEISDQTKTAEIQRLKAESVGALIENQAKQAGIKLTQEQVKKIGADITQGWEGLRQGDEKIAIEMIDNVLKKDANMANIKMGWAQEEFEEVFKQIQKRRKK